MPSQGYVSSPLLPPPSHRLTLPPSATPSTSATPPPTPSPLPTPSATSTTPGSAKPSTSPSTSPTRPASSSTVNPPLPTPTHPPLTPPPLDFIAFGDFPRSSLPALQSLLNSGVKVALLHGDRDYRANWFGGELLSLALSHTSSPAFRAAGYAPLRTTPSSPIAGQTRQHANLSFSRIYQAGHEAAYYRPEAVYTVFARTLKGKDVATGMVAAGSGYSTTGPASVRGVSAGPVAPQGQGECYVEWAPLGERCSAAQVGALVAGTAVVAGAGGRVVVSPAA